MKVFINPGHDLRYDPGAVNPNHLETEAIFAAQIGELLSCYLNDAGCEVIVMQSDNLYYDSVHPDCSYPVCVAANEWGADIFVSIHCNSAATTAARGTETLVYGLGGSGEKLGRCIQRQIVTSVGTIDRGIKVRPELSVLKHTKMPAVLVEVAFINNEDDFQILKTRTDDIARAIARGVTDYM